MGGWLSLPAYAGAKSGGGVLNTGHVVVTKWNMHPFISNIPY